MMRKLPFSFGIILLLAAMSVCALPEQEALAKLFTQGNSDFQNGNYEAAERNFHLILDSGVESGAVYYNLGNTCFKQKKLGEAIYYWEKALQKLPSDSDIQGNLELANLLIVDRLEIPADPFPVRLLSRAVGLLTISQESWLILILFIVANALFSIYLLVKNPRLSFPALVGCFVVMFFVVIVGCSLAWKIYDRSHRQEAIVVEQKVDVRSGPGDENIAVFTIHEGIKVRLRGLSGGWYQVSLPNGWNGWLQQDSVLVL